MGESQTHSERVGGWTPRAATPTPHPMPPGAQRDAPSQRPPPHATWPACHGTTCQRPMPHAPGHHAPWSWPRTTRTREPPSTGLGTAHRAPTPRGTPTAPARPHHHAHRPREPRSATASRAIRDTDSAGTRPGPPRARRHGVCQPPLRVSEGRLLLTSGQEPRRAEGKP